MLMEWLEPTIKVRISETQIDVDNASRELYSRLSQIIHKTMEVYPDQSRLVLEIDDLINEIITVGIDLTYRQGFVDCFKLFTSIV